MKAYRTLASNFPTRIAFIVIAAIILSSCGFTPTPTPTPVLVRVTPTFEPTAIATEPPPTATITSTPEPTATRTLTPRPTPTRPRLTLTPTIPPGIYVTAIQVEPTTPKSNQEPVFHVTFLNTTSRVQKYRWFVKIYKPEETSSFGETARGEREIPLKTSQLLSLASWKTLIMECTPFIARVFWVDAENQVHELLKPDGNSPAKGFNVCP